VCAAFAAYSPESSTLRGVSDLTPWVSDLNWQVSDLPFRLRMTALEQPDNLGVAKTLRLAERGVSPSVLTIKGNLHSAHCYTKRYDRIRGQNSIRSKKRQLFGPKRRLFCLEKSVFRPKKSAFLPQKPTFQLKRYLFGVLTFWNLPQEVRFMQIQDSF
jgi:hypothetical protein